MWPCQYCGHENDESLAVCDNCGALRDEVGDSGDNSDSENLFFDMKAFKNCGRFPGVLDAF